MKQMWSRQHKKTENEIYQTKANKLQVQSNINAYINKPTTQQIKFNPYQKHNEKEPQSNKNKITTRDKHNST